MCKQLPSKSFFLASGAFLLATKHFAEACTNIIVTPGASTDDTMILAYSADSHSLYGQIYHYPSVKVEKNDKNNGINMFDWDSGFFHGSIPQEAPVGEEATYNVVGNCNEHNLCIGETTFGGLEELAPQSGGIIDYGSLIYLTLQRTRTASQARDFMTSIVQKYGYASEGESFSIVDPRDAYILEMIGKGKYGKGTVWVSCQVPDGFILAHANHARINHFWNQTDCIHSNDVVDFAITAGLYNATTKEDASYSDFSFAGVYDAKKSFEMRYTDARVWDIYRSFLTPKDRSAFDDLYLDHIMGKDVENNVALPLFLMPASKVSLDDVRHRMSSHYENTPLEFGSDVGGGIFETPYRPRPMSWTYDGKTYVNERSIAVSKTGWNFIAHLRPESQVAHECLQTIMWFGADDCSTAPRIPVFPCSTDVSDSYWGLGPQQGSKSRMMEFDIHQAFWIQNMVSNFAYYRWNDAYPLLKAKLEEVHQKFEAKVEKLQVEVKDALLATGQSSNTDHSVDVAEKNRAKVVEMVSAFTRDAGDDMQNEWIKFYGELFVRLRDFVVIEKDETNLSCGCKPEEIGMSKDWQKRIVAERGEHYEVPTAASSVVSDDISQRDPSIANAVY